MAYINVLNDLNLWKGRTFGFITRMNTSRKIRKAMSESGKLKDEEKKIDLLIKGYETKKEQEEYIKFVKNLKTGIDFVYDSAIMDLRDMISVLHSAAVLHKTIDESQKMARPPLTKEIAEKEMQGLKKELNDALEKLDTIRLAADKIQNEIRTKTI